MAKGWLGIGIGFQGSGGEKVVRSTNWILTGRGLG